jgi:hypothetical protein
MASCIDFFTKLRFVDYIIDDKKPAAIYIEPLRLSEGAVNTAFGDGEEYSCAGLKSRGN